jgi:hypothetical protein
VTLGEERRKQLNVCILGDDVSKLKPDPLIYVTASEKLNIDPNRCVVVEDSLVGLKAAKGAVCVISSISNRFNISCTNHLWNFFSQLFAFEHLFSSQGMKCLITYTKSTENEDFYGYGADAKVPELESAGVTFGKIFDPIKENGLDAEILAGIKD